MKAFLLAAGVGSRLGALTARTPKCLLPVGGRPLLNYWFDAFQKVGVDEVLINLHHHPDSVRSYLASLSTGCRVLTFYEDTLLGSAGTIRAAWDFVADDDFFFIVYADNYAEVDLRRLLAFHLEKQNPPLTLVAYPTDEPSRCGILELDRNGLVVTFEEKPAHPRSNFANAGIHVASRDVRDFLPDSVPADLGFHVLPALVGKMYGYVTQEYVQDIGTPVAYEKVQNRFMAKGAKTW
jgi:mannose-1-phosphate guanylyltransferase